MALRTVLTWPDSRLRDIATDVSVVDQSVLSLVEDLFDTMYAESGVGLASTQIGVPMRVVVVDCSAEQDAPIALINPKIIRGEGTVLWREGCLSLPGVTAEVERFESVEVEYLDFSGQPVRHQATGLEAVCIQHEIDHLDGQLYIDRLAELERKATLLDYDEAQASTDERVL